MSNPDFNTDEHYRCRTCRATGVKLWREYQTFLRDDPKLLCQEHAEKDQGRILKPSGDQIGWLVPAVPSATGGTRCLASPSTST